MSGIRTVTRGETSFTTHGVVFDRTLCGCAVTARWVELTDFGSLHSLTCANCRRVLIASGDLPVPPQLQPQGVFHRD